MRYFVLSDDGNRYGPVDIETLNLWAAERRILPHQMLADEATGFQLLATTLPGLSFPIEPAFAETPPTYAGYPRTMPDQFVDTGQNDVTVAWVCNVIGLFSCPLVAIAGLVFANKAIAKGNPGGNAPRIFAIVVLCLVGFCFLGALFLPLLGEVITRNG